jgi:putative toxin-antitoxin system antitoxin component (TIGR02293 family)
MKTSEEVIIMYGVSIGLQPQSSAKLIAKIKEGLSVKAFDRLCKNLNISEKALAKTLNIAISTLARRKNTGRMTFAESERIYRFARLYDRAVEVFGDKEMGRKWLKGPAWALGNVTPLEFAETELGAQEVDDLLGRIEYGVFT